jgi:hypothetical protein
VHPLNTMNHWLAMVLALMPLCAQWVQAQTVEQIEQPVAEAVSIRRQTHIADEQWRDERQALLAEWTALERRQEQLQAQKALLEQTTTAARARIAAKDREVAEIAQMAAQIEPFLHEQLIRLEVLMDADLPFLPAERRQRLASLTMLMGDPDAAVGEKMHKAMEGLFVEAEYGDTIEVYQETITVDGRPVLTDIFRLGRLALFYQTLDRKQCGYYDVAAASWQPLPGKHNRAIQAAIEIGSRRKPVELLSMPLGRMVAP